MGSKPHNVAVIGAGVSGVVSALHFNAVGLTVTVYERSSDIGGVWLYDSRRPPEPEYPSIDPSVADFAVEEDTEFAEAQEIELDVDHEQLTEAELLHAPPGPCYERLMNNIATALIQLKNHPWGPGTSDYIHHSLIKDYIQAAARKSGGQATYVYNTRVERVWKREAKWQIQSTKLAPAEDGKLKKSRRVREFDAVVVASGHYHACRIPYIAGINAWKKAWPDRIHHSKAYRTPSEYKNQNVLLIGAGVSSTDIAGDIASVVDVIYQSARGGPFDIPTEYLPQNTSRVGEISSFNELTVPHDQKITPETPIPGTITLKDGTVLRGIHQIIFCTGYHLSYPFLRSLHHDSVPVEDADDFTLVTDGTQMHNLHKDIFYIPDPTLAFVGVPYYCATFTLFEFQAIAIAAVYSGRTKIPPVKAMRDEYSARLQRKGHGRGFHSLLTDEVEYVDDLVGWINEDTAAEPVEGHTATWRAANTARIENIRAQAEARGKKFILGDISTY